MVGEWKCSHGGGAGMSLSLGVLAEPPGSPRTTSATYLDKNGHMQIAKPGVLRPNYVLNDAGVWMQQGFLREEQSTNYVYSNTSYSDCWTRVNANFSEVDGIMDGIFGFRWESDDLTPQYMANGNAVDNINSFSLWIKTVPYNSAYNVYFTPRAGTVNITLNIDKNGLIISSNYTLGKITYTLVGGWYKVNVTNVNSWIGKGIASPVFWGGKKGYVVSGLQAESSSAPTSLIATSGSISTRTSDYIKDYS